MFEGYHQQCAPDPADLGMSVEEELEQARQTYVKAHEMWEDKRRLGELFMDELCCLTEEELGSIMQQFRSDPTWAGAKLSQMMWKRIMQEAEKCA